MGKKTVQAFLVWVLSAIASVAAADRGTVFLTNGGQVAGELVEYVPGDHVTIDLGGGQRLSFPAAEVASVQVGVAPGVVGAPEAPRVDTVPAAPATTLDPHVQELLMRRHELTRRRIGFGGPIALMAAGAGVTLLGWGVIFPLARDNCNSSYYDGSYYRTSDCSWGPGAVAGAIIGSVGIALAITGAAILPGRIAKRRNRAREVEAIDGELRGLGFTARVEPWLRGGQNSLFGLRATLTF